MALSFCPSFGSFHHQQEYEQIETELPDFQDNFNYFSSDNFINPLLESDEFFHSDTYTNLLPFLSSPPENLISISPDIFPVQEFESYQYPKRQRISYPEDYNSTSLFDGYVANSDQVTELVPEIAGQVAKFEVPAEVEFGEGMMKKSLSAQSIAARERRRKITEKTQQLGKLIPGGNKMNTAEMLQAASNYVKFMQAQLQLLQLFQSTQEKNEEDLHRKELQILASPAIQEKLYSQEKCLVPREFLQTIANDHQIQSTPSIIHEIDLLLGTNS